VAWKHRAGSSLTSPCHWHSLSVRAHPDGASINSYFVRFASTCYREMGLGVSREVGIPPPLESELVWHYVPISCKDASQDYRKHICLEVSLVVVESPSCYARYTWPCCTSSAEIRHSISRASIRKTEFGRNASAH
jgi:hypothetical protein